MAMKILKAGNNVRPKPNLNILCTGNSAIHLAIVKGYTDKSKDGKELKYSNFEIVKKLVECGADVNIQNRNGNTPLHLAYLRRDQDMINFLLDKGADRNLKNKNNEIPSYMSNKTYDEAYNLLIQSTIVFFLDKNKFSSVKE